MDEKETMLPRIKADGDAMFRAGDFTKASEHYTTGLAYIEGIASSPVPRARD